MKLLISGFFDSLRIKRCSWVPDRAPERIPLAGWIALFVLFSILYSWIGFLCMQTGCFSQVDVFFGSDVRWMVGDIAEFSANHYRTNTHPLGALLVNPAGWLLNLLTGSSEVTTVLMMALIGSSFVVLFGSFLLRMGLARPLAVLCMLLLGVSSTHLLWAAVPDYFLVDGVLLLFFLWVCVACNNRLWLVIAAAVAAAGAVTTHLPLVVMLYVLVRHGSNFNLREAVCDGLKFFAIVFFAMIFLALLQNVIYPSSTLFFRAHALQSRTEFMGGGGLVGRLFLLVPYLFVSNMVFPAVTGVSIGNQGEVGIRFSEQWNEWPTLYSGAGWISIVLWIVLLALCLIYAYRQRLFMRSFIVVGACSFLFHLALHMVYGRPDEFFLYTPHWTFMLIAFVGITLDDVARQSVGLRRSILILLSMLTGIMTISNALVIQQMLNLLA